MFWKLNAFSWPTFLIILCFHQYQKQKKQKDVKKVKKQSPTQKPTCCVLPFARLLFVGIGDVDVGTGDLCLILDDAVTFGGGILSESFMFDNILLIMNKLMNQHIYIYM